MKRTGMWMSSVALAATLSSAAFSLTHEQSQELRRTGQITIHNEDGTVKGHYEVSFIPGQENILRNSHDHWVRAGHLLDDLIAQDFWTNSVYHRYTTGLGYIEAGVTKGVGEIPSQFKSMVELNREARGKFGYAARVLRNGIGFATSVVGDIFRTVGEGVFGVIYAVVVPAGTILYRPIGAGTEAIAAGTLWPVVKFTWNTTSWAVSANNHEPTGSDMFVTFVPEHLPAHPTTTGTHEAGVDTHEASSATESLELPAAALSVDEV